MIESKNFKDVVWFPDGTLLHGKTVNGGWYFWDEARQLSAGGPCRTEALANAALEDYVKEIDAKRKDAK